MLVCLLIVLRHSHFCSAISCFFLFFFFSLLLVGQLVVAAMSSSSSVAPFALLRLLNLELVPTAGVAPPVASLLLAVEAAVVEMLLEEAVAEVVDEFSVVAGDGGGMPDSEDEVRPLHPFWLSPPMLSPDSASDSEFAVDAPSPEVPVRGLVLARALVPFSVAPVTPPVAPVLVPRSPRVPPRWGSGVLFPYADAVAAVRVVQRADVVWYNGDVRMLPIPAPPSPPPRRSRRIARRRLY